MSIPNISVIIPTYNRGGYITTAIKSVLAQSYHNYEVIVVDDGSTDNTKEVLQPYMNSIIYIFQQNKGVSAARNAGLRASNGQYIMFLDSDDYIAERAINEQITALESAPDAGWAYSKVLVLDEQKNVLNTYPPKDILDRYGKYPEGYIFEELFIKHENFLPINAVVSRKTAIGNQLFDENLVGYEDWDFWVRLAANYKAKFIDEVLAFVIRHSNSAQTRFIEFQTGRAMVIHKICKLYPEKTRSYKRILATKAAGAHNIVASACLKKNLLSNAAAESLRSIISYPTGQRAYLNFGLVVVKGITVFGSTIKSGIREILKSITPEKFKQIFRQIRPALLSIGLSNYDNISQPGNEIESSREISIIVPVHDSPDFTRRCLKSIEKYGAGAEVILVDDASQLNETVNLINGHQQRNGWQVVRHSKALRHSRACEAGCRLATRRYLCLLNSDVVLTPWSWNGVKEAFESDPKIAVVGPSTSHASTRQMILRAYHCRYHWTDGQINAFAKQYISQQQPKSLKDVLSVDGFAFFIRRTIWEQFSGFDPLLADYGNETELCGRLLKAGLRIVWTQNSYIHHFGQGSYGSMMSPEKLREKQETARTYITNLHGTTQVNDC